MTPRLNHYLITAPQAPDTCDWSASVKQPWGMLLNDQLGDCTAAAAGHLCQTWSANTVGEVSVTDNSTLSFYEGSCGYNPANPSTDQGGVELDVLTYWQKNSFGGSYTIDAFASINPKRQDIVKSGIWVFGGIYIGLALPISAQTQPIWDLPTGGLSGDGAPGSWGGHAVAVIAYDANGLTCVTWGQTWRMTWAFFNVYCDEAYALLSPLWYASRVPNGIDIPALKQDMADFQSSSASTPTDSGQDPMNDNPIPSTPSSSPDGSILQISVGNITVSVSQAFANLVVIALGTALFMTGKFDLTSIATYVGTAMALVAGGNHLRTLQKSNDDTNEFAGRVVTLLKNLKFKAAIIKKL